MNFQYSGASVADPCRRRRRTDTAPTVTAPLPAPHTPCRPWRRALRAAVLGLALGAAAATAVAATSSPAAAVAEIQRRLGSGQAQAALELAERTAAAEPRLAAPRFLQGVALMDLQRDDEALALFTAFSQDWPELPDPLNNIALLHARAGRLDAALGALQAALRADPAHRAARLNLAEVHLALAVRAWDEAAAAAPLDAVRQRRLQAVRALLSGAER